MVAEPNVFDVVDGFLEEDAHVCVMQRVHHAASFPLADNQAQMSQEAKLMRDG